MKSEGKYRKRKESKKEITKDGQSKRSAPSERCWHCDHFPWMLTASIFFLSFPCQGLTQPLAPIKSYMTRLSASIKLQLSSSPRCHPHKGYSLGQHFLNYSHWSRWSWDETPSLPGSGQHSSISIQNRKYFTADYTTLGDNCVYLLLMVVQIVTFISIFLSPNINTSTTLNAGGWCHVLQLVTYQRTGALRNASHLQ